MTVTSSNGLVGELRTPTDSGPSVPVTIPAGQYYAGVEFRGLSSGTTQLTAAGGGMQVCGDPGVACGGYLGRVNVTVN